MGRFTEMISPVRRPDRTLPVQPDRIRPVTGAPPMDWGTSPTGWQPDHNAETLGRVSAGYPVREPNGSDGGPRVPVEPFDGSERVDQHPYLQVSASWLPSSLGNGRLDGLHDPLTDGLPQPVLRLLSLHYYRESGASRTRYMDVPDGRSFPAVGTQDGASWTYYQDAATAMEPYQPDPETGYHKDSFMKLPPGPAHGWSNVPVMGGAQLKRKQDRDIKMQQQAVGQNRLSNSTYAGQTYSQQTRHVANPSPGAVPSWRGRG